MEKAFIDTSVILRILVEDDDLKSKACGKLLRDAKKNGIALHLLPIAVMEIVWVLEKVYKFDRKRIREIATALLNTPELHVEMEDAFRKALTVYEEKNIKFADAIMSAWGLECGLSTVYTYDEKHFKRIEGLKVKKP